MSHSRKRFQKTTLAKRPSDRDISKYFTKQAFIVIVQFPGEKKNFTNVTNFKFKKY